MMALNQHTVPVKYIDPSNLKADLSIAQSYIFSSPQKMAVSLTVHTLLPPADLSLSDYIQNANTHTYDRNQVEVLHIAYQNDDRIYANNPSFGYMDAMLENWRELGLNSPEKLTEHKLALQKEKHRKGQGPRPLNKKAPEENFSSKHRDLNSLIE